MLILPACSLMPEPAEDKTSSADNALTQAQDVSDIGKEIADMVTMDDNPKLTSQNTAAEQDQTIASQNTRNLYIEQQQKRLVDVPKAVLTQFEYALSLMKSKQWSKANQQLDDVLSAYPKLSGARVNKAIIAMTQNKLSLANEQLVMAIQANENNPYAYLLKGKLERLQGDFAQAEQSYLKALTIWPQYPEVHVNMAILLELYRGRLVEARGFYLSYLKLSPDDIQAQRWLAGVELKIKRAGIPLPEANKNSGAG